MCLHSGVTHVPGMYHHARHERLNEPATITRDPLSAPADPAKERVAR